MYTKTNMKRVKTPSDVPKDRHFAVIIYNTTYVHVEGDERSRTCPGHGYPAHTDPYDTFEHWVTTDKQVLTGFVHEIEVENSRPYATRNQYVVLNVEGTATVSKETFIKF